MPTAARLAAAISLAIVALVVSEMVKPRLPEGTDFGWFVPINIGLGLIAGWTTVGLRAGRGVAAAISNGLTGMAAMVLWALLVQAINEMVRLAMRHRFDGPMEAFVGIFQIGVDYAGYLADAGIIAVLVVGGALAGLAAENAWRRWP